MENRIQINGVWYVMEDISQEKEKDIQVYYAKTCTHENDDYVWEATKLMKDDGISYYPDIDIKFTDKRIKPWKEEHWDSNQWMKDILNNDPDSMEDARESMCEQGIKEFKLFLKKLKEEGWLKTS